MKCENEMVVCIVGSPQSDHYLPKQVWFDLALRTFLLIHFLRNRIDEFAIILKSPIPPH